MTVSASTSASAITANSPPRPPPVVERLSPADALQPAEPVAATQALAPARDKTETESKAAEVTASLEEINRSFQQMSIGVQFALDKETDTMVAKVVDAQTGQVIRQIPSEEVLHISKVMGKLQDLMAEQSVRRRAELGLSPGDANARWSNPWGTAAAATEPLSGGFRSLKV